VFSVVLRLPGMGATSNVGSEQRTLGHSESCLSVMCEVTGGRAVAVTGMRK
jgi:hypothetical protein